MILFLEDCGAIMRHIDMKRDLKKTINFSLKRKNMAENYKPVKTSKVSTSPFTGVVGWIDTRLPIIRMMKHEYLDFQVPKNLNYFFSLNGIDLKKNR